MSLVIGFIPCRSGSKRIKNKNLSSFLSKSLIQRTYDLAKKSKNIDNIILSTDSIDYLEGIKKCSKYIDIGLRSKRNSMDYSTDLDVLREVINKLKILNIEPKEILHLRPTYPALIEDNIDDAYKYFKSCAQATSLKSVEKTGLYFQKCFVEDGEDSNRLIGLDGDYQNRLSSIPSQKCNTLYAQTAAIDIYQTNNILSGFLWGNYCLKYEIGEEAADIDNYYDFPRAYSSLDQLNALKKLKRGEKLEICFDIDGVLFSRTHDNDYSFGIPNEGIISLIRKLSQAGHSIILHTARGSKTGTDWRITTEKQMKKYKIPYDNLIFQKPGSDFYIDDKFITVKNFYKLMEKSGLEV